MEDFDKYSNDNAKSLAARSKILESKINLENPVPSMYQVKFMPDSTIPEELVIFVLEDIFHKSSDEIKNIIEYSSCSDEIIAGTYTQDIAETKRIEVIQYSRDSGFPIKCLTQKDARDVIKKS